MGLLDSTQESTDAALATMATLPLDPVKPEPKHSGWTTIPRAIAAGASEIGANIMDTLGAAGQVVAATGGITPGFDPNDKRQESLAAAEKLKTDGIDWRSAEAKPLYDYAESLRPDPVTAGKAEQIVFGVGKGLTKAVGGSLVLGPVGGAAAFGASEGMTASEDLARQGVDQETRTKVGATVGALNTVMAALPVAGNTVSKTLTLAAVGGPGSFIVQQQATRSILENANYDELAQQYDPLDPTGLAISTLFPIGFGAYAMRGARTARAASPDIVAPKTEEVAPMAQDVAIKATPDDIDAAMVHNLTIARDAHQDTTVEKFAAELWRGPVIDNPNFKEWFGDSKVIDSDGQPLVVYHGTASAGFDSFRQMSWFTDLPEKASGYAERKEGDNQAVYPVYISIKNPKHADLFALQSDVEKWLSADSEYDGVIVDRSPIQGERNGMFYVVKNPSQIKSAIGNSGKFDPNSPSLTDPLAVKESLTPEPTAQDTTPDAYRARVDQLLTDQPDMVSRIDDAGQPVRMADEIAQIRKTAKEGTDTELGAQDAPLLQIAAECFLSLGQAA